MGHRTDGQVRTGWSHHHSSLYHPPDSTHPSLASRTHVSSLVLGHVSRASASLSLLPSQWEVLAKLSTLQRLGAASPENTFFRKALATQAF